jgi:radical SAM-linked protein
LLRRAVRRAGGRLALSAGLRPKPLLSLALPRAVGVEGAAELGEFTLAEPPPAAFGRRLASGLPDGFSVLGLEPLAAGAAVAARVVGARYRVVATAGAATADLVPEGLVAAGFAASRRYTAEKELVVERARAGKRRMVDVRQYVSEVDVAGSGLGLVVSYTAAVTPQGTVRPEEVVEVLGRLACRELVVWRAERLEILLGDPAAREV